MASDSASETPDASSSPVNATHFFDLPQEVRDMVYIYWPKLAWIDIAQTYPAKTNSTPDQSVNQPVTSKVCRRMRTECLDVFYGKNKFLMDLRGWKHSAYPKPWTPLMIYEKWIQAIGDDNAARMRALMFWSHNYSVYLTVEVEKPRLRLKFRTSPSNNVDIADGAPPGYSFPIAARRAEAGLRSIIDRIEVERDGGPLRAQDLLEVGQSVERLQPFLCRRLGLGNHGATLRSGDVESWPDASQHLVQCDDCGYHRYTQ